MQKHNIYALCEPGTLEARYIGRSGCDIRKRLGIHIAAAKRGGTAPVNLWIRELVANNQEPSVILLGECPTKMVKSVERAWVHLFQDNGYNLLNVQLMKAMNGDTEPQE